MDHDTVFSKQGYKQIYSTESPSSNWPNLIWQIKEKKIGGKVNNHVTNFNMTLRQRRWQHTQKYDKLIRIHDSNIYQTPECAANYLYHKTNLS